MKNLLFALLVLSNTIIFAQPCSNLFFSEYVEGSSNNKALEITNPSSVSVNLSGYSIQTFANGGTSASNTLNLVGTLPAGSSYVIVNSQSNQAILDVKDTSSAVTFFNGNDAVALFNGTTVLDVIGEIGNDPGANGWAVSTGFTKDNTLVRKVTVNEGTTNWVTGASQWDVLAIDVTTDLGSHTFNACALPADSVARFSPSAATVLEDAGTYTINVQLNQAVDVAKTISIALKSGNAADVSNFATQTVNFAANTSSQNVTVTLVDNGTQNANSLVVFRLFNPSSGLLLGSDSLFTLTIADDDAPLNNNILPISALTGVDADGVLDSLGVVAEVRGTVLGINTRATGLQFTINDGTGGLVVFSNANSFGYNVNEGDSLAVIGEVDDFSGAAQLSFLDTVYKVGTGTVPVPNVINFPDESTEGFLVRSNNLTLVDVTQWDNSNPNGFTVDVRNANGDEFEIRIDEQTALFNEPRPTGTFSVIGIGGQFDASSPYTSFYNIAPRYLTDLVLVNGITEKQKGITSLNVYPNPAQEKAIIEFNAEIPSKAAVYVIDITGKQVYNENYNFNKGSNTVLINTTNLSNGLYIVEINGNELLSRSKLNISK